MGKRETSFEDEEEGYRLMLLGKRRRTVRPKTKNNTSADEQAPANIVPSSSVPSNTVLPDQADPDATATEVDVAEPGPSQSLYLETVDRSRLDFDFEKLCSVSLSNTNVYACMTCGKYFQGRGSSSHAYFHSIDRNHHVHINLRTLKVYVLPEGYEVTSPALDDIKYVADPIYTKQQVAQLDKFSEVSRKVHDLRHNEYTPGFIGMNNIKENDYANVVVQALAHVTPLRNFMMLEKNLDSIDANGNTNSSSKELVKRTSVLVRKIWNPRAFKPHVSPHELLQHVSVISNKRFSPVTSSDPFDFLNWLLNQLHLALGGSKTRPQSSIVQMIFQGRLRVQSQKITLHAVPGDRLRFEADERVREQEMPFMFLSLDLVPTPLFKGDAEQQNVIPQVLLSTLLAKYDGTKTQELAGYRKRYKLLTLPPFLTLHVKRLNKSKTGGGSGLETEDWNPTVVSFGPQNLDMAPYVEGSFEPIYYDLVANITHDVNSSEQGGDKHVWKIQLLNKSTQKWIEIQDLRVDEVRTELLFLSESYVQIWERRKTVS